MPSVYDLKPAFQRCLQPLLLRLSAWGVTPNQLTWAGIVLSLAGGALAVCGARSHPPCLLLVPVVLFVRMALNALDGMMARQRQLSSRAGEVLNEVGDVVSDIALYLPFALFVSHDFAALTALAVMLLLGVLCEFCGVLGKAVIGVRQYQGPMGKSDRALVMGLFALALFFFPVLAVRYAACVFGAMSLLLALSCWHRLRAVLKA